jgi:ribosomal protein L11 methyltransferase
MTNLFQTMDYCELYVTCTSPPDTEVIGDLLAAELAGAGFDSFVQHADGLSAYIPVDRYRVEEVERCLANFPLDGVRFDFTQTLIPDKNWNEVWETNCFQPVRIDRRCLLRAPFHPSEPGFEHELVIQPEMTFGTGNHETTYLMICEMLALTLQGCDVLDMGCGTAVLAILAAGKGAASVTAIDIDERACRNAVENCSLNSVAHVRVIRGDAGAIPPDSAFDCIFANINRNVLLHDIRYFVPALKPGGLLFLSGFYTGDVPLLKAECERNGLELLSCIERNRWAAMKTQRTCTIRGTSPV